MQECRPCRALFILLSAFTQGSISGFALILPWAMQECRPYRAIFILLFAFTQGFISGFASFHPGLCGSAALSGLFSFFYLRLPRVSYRALPLFHPGLCRSAALAGLFIVLFAVYPGFHIGLCPYSSLGFAGVPPFQGSLSYWAFAVLCRGIVFVKCVWVCKWIVAFVYLFDCDCMGCGEGLFVEFDWCGRTMSPKGAILLHSPGREPWVRCVKIYFEPRWRPPDGPQRGGTPERINADRCVEMLALLA